jgi:HNH endonuclease
MAETGDVISYFQMCALENMNMRRGMNFRPRGRTSVLLMSVRPGAPYKDRVEDNGKTLIYEGHDDPVPPDGRKPKEADQQSRTPDGKLTQNGLFFDAAERYKAHESGPEVVRVYEKIRAGIWVYNGHFELNDAWTESSGGRRVFKFRLRLVDDVEEGTVGVRDVDRTRIIPSPVKLEVWKRDAGKCVKCGSTDNLHFDHIIPYSWGGTSLDAKNIQLLCARHNLQKHDRIE